MIVCYFDIQSHGLDYHMHSNHTNYAWIYVWPGGEDIVIERIRNAVENGLGIILNIQGIVWNISTWTFRPTAIQDWDRMDARFTEANVWRYIVGFHCGEEPFHHAAELAIREGRNVNDAKDNMATHLRVMNNYLKTLYPTKYKLGIHAYTELLPDHSSFIGDRPNLGFDVVGFDVYSDGKPYGETLSSYAWLLSQLKSLVPTGKYVLVPDGIMFTEDNLQDKLARINWICALGWNDPTVIGIIPYCWSSTTPYTGVKENLSLLNFYSEIGSQLKVR